MRIGIVSSGNENLYLFQFLSQFDASFVVYYDSKNWPYDDKGFAHTHKSVEQGIIYLRDQGCDAVIVSPIYELFFLSQKKYAALLVPLFSRYLTFCLAHSLVGKIGLVGDFSSLEKAQELCASYASSVTLTAKQKNTKKFHQPWSRRTREVPLRNYLLRRLSPRQYMVNTIVKTDLRYFKNAAVDTLVPLNYSYFAYQRTITNYLNRKKYKFHQIDVLKSIFTECFSTLTTSSDAPSSHSYDVALHSTGSLHMLEQQKSLIWMMQRGKEVALQYNHLADTD